MRGFAILEAWGRLSSDVDMADTQPYRMVGALWSGGSQGVLRMRG